MDFEFSQEQKMFRETIRSFTQNEIAPLVDEADICNHGTEAQKLKSFAPKFGNGDAK